MEPDTQAANENINACDIFYIIFNEKISVCSGSSESGYKKALQYAHRALHGVN